jgi:ferritin-like metal-binding protein YciE
MTAATSKDCAAIKAILSAGAEVVVVADDALEGALRIAEKIREEHHEIVCE